MKNTLLHLLVRLLKPSPKEHFQRHFLIVSTTGLGDTLWATPAISALKTQNPNSLLTALTSPIGKQVLEKNPHVDACLVLKDPVFFSLFSMYKTLKRKKITDILLFHTSQRPILPMLTLLGAQNSVGIQGENKGLDALLSIALPKQDIHEVDKRLSLVKALGFEGKPSPLEFFWEEEALMAQKPYLCIHPGAQDHFKEWEEEHFIELGKRLTKEFALYVTGTPKEKERVENIAKGIPTAIPYLSTSLDAFATLLKHAKALIVGDTGPMHLAVALQTPTVALFCPTTPKLCGPYLPQGKVILLAKQKTCTPCLRKKCRDPFCLLQIGVDAVYDAVQQIL